MSGEHLYKQSVKRGALFLIASAATFSLVGVVVKTLTADLPLEMVVFFRSSAGLVFLTPWLLINRRVSLRTHNLRDHIIRAVSGVLAMYCFFFTISQLSLAEAITLNFTSPLIIPIVAFLVLGERLPLNIFRLLLVGFFGVLLIVKPGATVFQPAAVVGAVSAVFAAIALVHIRKITRTEPAIRLVFYFSVIATIITFLPMIRVWKNLEPLQWGLVFVMGALATIGQWLLTRGYASAPAGQIGYYQYSAVVFAGMMDWIIWRAMLDWVSIVGIGIICIAGVAASQRVASPLPARAV